MGRRSDVNSAVVWTVLFSVVLYASECLKHVQKVSRHGHAGMAAEGYCPLRKFLHDKVCWFSTAPPPPNRSGRVGCCKQATAIDA